MRRRPAELAVVKRDGGTWTDDEIEDLVAGVVDGGIGDAQLGALLMAICCRGMSVAETSKLTLAMRDSGRVLDLSAIAGSKVDKHSTGGVGDKVSLLLAPWVASAGVPVPMISGRGLGHTGGTLDKLHAIPGYRTDLSLERFQQVLAECGYVMGAATAEIAPADRRMYAIRDISGTVESIPLITASILSKKLAEGIDGLVMDVKCGRAAFMRTREDADALMASIVSTGRAAGVDVVALLTDMDAPLGRAVGNALEVAEVVACLEGRGPADLMEVTEALAIEMLRLGGMAHDREQARAVLAERLASGAVHDRLRHNVRLQGGDPAFVDDPSRLGRAPSVVPITAGAGGERYVVDIDPMAIGLCALELGAGRRQPEDDVDPLVGIVLGKSVGERVEPGDVLAEVHARSAAGAEAVADRVRAAVRLGTGPVARRSRLLGRTG